MIAVKAAGEAGQGVESSSAGFAKTLVRAGLHVFTVLDYHSRIRGGHNFAVVRAAPHPLWAHTETADILLAFNEEAVSLHLDTLSPGGVVVYDQGLSVDEGAIRRRGLHALPAPLARIAREASDSEVMANTAAFAVATGLMDLPPEPIFSVIRDNFRRKGEAVVEANLAVARAAYEWVR